MAKLKRLAGSPSVRARVRGSPKALAVALAMLLALMLALPQRLSAEDAPGSKPDIWLVTVGSWAVFEPRFEGSSHFSTNARPIFNIRKEGSREWLVLPNDGFDFELIETDNFRAGPVGNWHWQRHIGSGTGLSPRGFKRIGSVDLSLEAGGFAEYWPTNAFRTRAELRHSVIGGKGMIADLTADAVWRATPALLFTAGPRISIADSDFMRAYYAVDAAQSAALNLPAYAAKAGLRSMGAGTMGKYTWTENWATMTFVEYQRLSGDAGDSPVISTHGTRDQISVGAGVSYTFSVGR